MQRDGDWIHAWDYCCKQYLTWCVSNRRQVSALLCDKCGKQYLVGGKTAYRLGGSVNALAAVEEPKKWQSRHQK